MLILLCLMLWISTLWKGSPELNKCCESLFCSMKMYACLNFIKFSSLTWELLNTLSMSKLDNITDFMYVEVRSNLSQCSYINELHCECSTSKSIPSSECLPRTYQVISVRGGFLLFVIPSSSWFLVRWKRCTPVPEPSWKQHGMWHAPRISYCSKLLQANSAALWIKSIWSMPNHHGATIVARKMYRIRMLAVGRCRIGSLIKYWGIYFCKRRF